MEIGSGLENQLKRQIQLTTEMRLSLDILAMPFLELMTFLENECIENPFLEMVDSDKKEESDYVEAEFEESVESIDTQDNLEWIATPTPSFPSYLEDQIRAVFKGKELEIALLLSRNLSPLGFLEATPAEISKILKVSTKKVEKVRKELMSIDSLGTASLNLEEYLIFQLEALGKNSINKKDLDEALKLLNFDTEKAKREFEHIFSLLKTLPAYPASDFGETNLARVVVDAVVEVVDGEKLEVGLTREPRTLIFNEEYIPVMKEAQGETLTFLKEKYYRAKEILRSLEKRKNTLKKVIYFITQKQGSFFTGKKSFPEPLTESEIGASLNLHQSTISRAIKNKMIRTPRGLFSLRSLIQMGSGGEEISKVQLKNEIISLIKSNPKLTDLQISQILEERGIKIARRTVAKYRKEEGIPVRRNRQVSK